MTTLTQAEGKENFVEHYEQLRDRAIRGAHTGTHVGMTLLRREGIAGWMARSVPGTGEPFDADSVRWVRYSTGLPSLKDRLIAAGMLTRDQISAKLGVGRSTVGRMRLAGSIEARICNNRGEWLYWPPKPVSADAPTPEPATAGHAMGRSAARGAV
jgi:hypothetical protein